VDGILVPTENVSAFADAMDTLMGDESERRKLASHAPEILDRFGLQHVMSLWESCIELVTR
jgi:glycosyltransferase involved in cell wall biosynthesis